MFDQFTAAVAAARTPGQRVRAQAMLENAACAARLSSMADLLEQAHRASGSADRDRWRCDNWASVCAQIGAAQTLTAGMVNSLLTHAVVLREKLPKVGAVFAEGLITYLLVRTICRRTALVKDPAALAAIDAELAAELRGWGAKSLDQTDADIDALILRHDPHAVRRVQDVVRSTGVTVDTDGATGVSRIEATVEATDGAAFQRRVELLARTVCDRDPRTADQRRAAAVGAMGFGWDRLPCMCETDGCAAASRPAVGGVVIHVITRRDTLHGTTDQPPPDPEPEPPTTPEHPEERFDVDPQPPDDGDEPSPDPDPDVETDSPNGESGSNPVPAGDLTAQRRGLVGEQPRMLSKPLREYTITELVDEVSADRGQYCPASPGVILGGPVLPAPVIARLAMHATVTDLIHPGHAPPEPRYRPSRALADFVKARDLRCRQPGCTRDIDDLDHTIPYPWGPTCASNLAGFCREHHLLKTFFPGWSSVQYPDGRIVFTDPDAQSSTSYPGSRLLFGELCEPTAPAATRGTPPPKHTAGLTMPTRAITRKQARDKRIDDERERNTPWAEQYLRDSIPPF
ncbi:HNH endonuclease signature motif containing protein [Mycolicibacterium arenosum]|uniref:HNH endonuclease n=1 Tax=Mycolicibacterium arenosum TaxID=2952157 RepID=A0ABT1LZV4_9MYCO|nr:HNH endonuclease signature motif containing protein [Mycolicibacterium sp. CAU 1645]MCP9272428.1 HNH endonuclease [Mycolicibacterium sp. CAU 1645]